MNVGSSLREFLAHKQAGKEGVEVKKSQEGFKVLKKLVSKGMVASLSVISK